MKQVSKLSKLKDSSYIDFTSLKKLTDIDDISLYSNINRWLKQGKLVQLKKGIYVSKEYLNGLIDQTDYKEFIANKLREPSYLSVDYVLQKHGLLSESVYSMTSITLKKTYSYSNELGNFVYYNISPELFTGYSIIDKSGYKIEIASKSKALFDFLYLKMYRVEDINDALVDSYRFNLEMLDKSDLNEFNGYIELTGQKKFKKLSEIIIRLKNATE